MEKEDSLCWRQQTTTGTIVIIIIISIVYSIQMKTFKINKISYPKIFNYITNKKKYIKNSRR